MTYPKAYPAPLANMMKSDADLARALERENILKQQTADDAARLAGGNVAVVAITSFTIVEGGPDAPQSRIVRTGEELEIPAFDLPSWAGRVTLKEMFLTSIR